MNMNVEANQFNPDRAMSQPTVNQKYRLFKFSGFASIATNSMDTATIRNKSMLNSFIL